MQTITILNLTFPGEKFSQWSMDQWTNGPMNQWTNGPMDQCTVKEYSSKGIISITWIFLNTCVLTSGYDDCDTAIQIFQNGIKQRGNNVCKHLNWLWTEELYNQLIPPKWKTIEPNDCAECVSLNIPLDLKLHLSMSSARHKWSFMFSLSCFSLAL